MENERTTGKETEFTDAELDMLREFTEAVQAGANPDMEEYLKRCLGSEARMRPILETALLLDREIAQFRRKFPSVDLGKLLDLKRKPQPGPQ